MNGLKFEGFDYGNHNPSYDLNSYAVGIYDEKRNSITLQPVHHIFAMNVIHANRDNIPQMNTSLSNYDRKHDLTEAFGSKKKKRAMKQQESNTISSESITGASALHEAVGIVASNNSDNVDDPTSTMDAASQALAAHRELMLPVHNMNATTLAEAYPPKDLYSGAVHHALKEWIEKMANEVAGLADSTPPLSRWKEVLHQRAIPEICLELIDSLYAAKVTSSGDTVGLKAFQKSLRLIIYLSSMMRLCECLISNSKDRPVARDVITTFLGDAPVALLRYLTDSFSTHKKVNGVHSFQATKTHAYVLFSFFL